MSSSERWHFLVYTYNDINNYYKKGLLEYFVYKMNFYIELFSNSVLFNL